LRIWSFARAISALRCLAFCFPLSFFIAFTICVSYGNTKIICYDDSDSVPFPGRYAHSICLADGLQVKELVAEWYGHSNSNIYAHFLAGTIWNANRNSISACICIAFSAKHSELLWDIDSVLHIQSVFHDQYYYVASAFCIYQPNCLSKLVQYYEPDPYCKRECDSVQYYEPDPDCKRECDSVQYY
jgi:hypothetical protein